MAEALVGCRLVLDRDTPAAVIATVVETEAYLGLDDEASHARRGPTPRAAIMFGAPGHLYVYLSYGVHFCANLVAHSGAGAGAVLLRAAAVEEGGETVGARRPGAMAAALLRGPGNLCRGLGLSLGDNGLDACSPEARLGVWSRAEGVQVPVVRGPRVGISRARDAALRFGWRDHPAVSAPRLR